MQPNDLACAEAHIVELGARAIHLQSFTLRISRSKQPACAVLNCLELLKTFSDNWWKFFVYLMKNSRIKRGVEIFFEKMLSG